MAGFRTICTAGLCLLGATALTQTVDAATIRQQLTCVVITSGTSGLGGGPVPVFAVIRNNLSFTIPGGTVYTYTVAGQQWTYQSPTALAPGQNLSRQVQYGVQTNQCVATIPGTLGRDRVLAPKRQMLSQ